MLGSLPDDECWLRLRQHMVSEQLAARDRGITDARALNALGSVPRHEFVPQEYLGEAYAAHPLAIGCGLTISQPFIVACMLEKLALKPSD